MRISWIGPFDRYGAYPTINRGLVGALEARGHTILRNTHSDAKGLTPICVYCVYPPRAPRIRHDINISYSTWEFSRLPPDFISGLTSFDLNVAMSQWVADNYRRYVRQPLTAVIHLGVDKYWFSEDERQIGWDGSSKHIVWMGGTDKRHGLDIALKVAEHLPPGYELAIYQYPNYPKRHLGNASNVIDISSFDGLSQVAHIYRGADCLLHTARAVGFSLPVLEAMAVGCPVVTTALPPVLEYCNSAYIAPSRYLPPYQEKHHIHNVLVDWHTPNSIEDVVNMIMEACAALRPDPVIRTWDMVAAEWEEVLSEWM